MIKSLACRVLDTRSIASVFFASAVVIACAAYRDRVSQHPTSSVTVHNDPFAEVVNLPTNAVAKPIANSQTNDELSSCETSTTSSMTAGLFLVVGSLLAAHEAHMSRSVAMNGAFYWAASNSNWTALRLRSGGNCPLLVERFPRDKIPTEVKNATPGGAG